MWHGEQINDGDLKTETLYKSSDSMRKMNRILTWHIQSSTHIVLNYKYKQKPAIRGEVDLSMEVCVNVYVNIYTLDCNIVYVCLQ